MTNTFMKDPSAILDYKFDFAPFTNGSPVNPEATDWLDVNGGETIASYVITPKAVTSGCVVSVIYDTITDSGTSVTVWIGGGELFKEYDVACKIITSSTPIARVDERTMRIKVVDR